MTKLYTVLPGFDWVAGRPTPENRQIALTDIEAVFDLSLDRIALKPDVIADPEAIEAVGPPEGIDPAPRTRR